MNKDELIENMEHFIEKAKFLLERDGYLVPVAFLFSGDNIGVIGLNFKDQREKQMTMLALKKKADENDADAIIVVVESWYISSPGDKKIVKVKDLGSHPDRKECIFVFGECEYGIATLMQKFEKYKDEIIFKEKIDISSSYSTFDFGIRNRKAHLN